MTTSSLNVDFLCSEEQVLAIMDEWRTLYRTSGHIFFSAPDLILLWWHTLGAEAGWKWHVATLRESGKLVAVAPLAVQVRYGIAIARWAGADVFDYCDVLAAAEHYQEALWNAVCRSPHYTFALLTDIHPQSRCRAFLEKHAHRYAASNASYLELVSETSEAWLKSLPSTYRKNFNRQSRRLEELGPLRYEMARECPLPDAVLDFLVEQKIAWCHQQGVKSIFDMPRIKDFIRGFAEVAAKSGILALSSLHCGDRLIAAQMDFVDKGIFYTYMPTYHQDWAPYSPGRVIEYRSIFWAIDQRCTRFDLMRGSEDYKKRLTEDYQTLHHYLLARGILRRCCGWLYLAGRQFKMRIAKERSQ